MKTVLEVKDCRDCPFRHSYRGHGECWEECRHPNAPKSYDSILWGCLAEFKATPEWCPLAEKSDEQAFQRGRTEGVILGLKMARDVGIVEGISRERIDRLIDAYTKPGHPSPAPK